MSNESKVARDRQALLDVESQGFGPRLWLYTKLSGPGWLQSAITLGGGSLAAALLMGVLGGTDLLWLQLVAIVMGVIMLSAIGFVTLTTGKKPFHAINEHVNPALGWSWAIATLLANMIWIMPQFSLVYDALKDNLVPGSEALKSDTGLWVTSGILLVFAMAALYLNMSGGMAGKIFDIFLKVLVGIIVLSFFGVVIVLTSKGEVNWLKVLKGFIPDPSQWNRPVGELSVVMDSITDEKYQTYWKDKVVGQQRVSMIGAAAAAVGINMTFLMPYSLLNRGWDKTFRGLARFDLMTGMAVPFVLVTSCIVIAAASSMHGTADEKLLSTVPAIVKTSPVFKSVQGNLAGRVQLEMGEEAFAALSEDEKLAKIAALPQADKVMANAVFKRSSSILASALEPLLGKQMAKTVFGIGVLGMGFSTIIILMLINGFVICEIFGQKQGGMWHMIGCLAAGMMGVLWPLFWGNPESKFWLTIMASTFGMMLLPIAYGTFMLMLNSKSLMGEDKPKGGNLICWNVLMGIAFIGATIGQISAFMGKMKAGGRTANVVIALLVILVVAIVAGFFLKKPAAKTNSE